MTIFWKLRHCGFNPFHSFCADPMHNIFIGCVCRLVNFWFDSKFSREPYSCRHRQDNIDVAIKELQKQVPHEFSRRPQLLGEGFLSNTKGKILILALNFGTKDMTMHAVNLI